MGIDRALLFIFFSQVRGVLVRESLISQVWGYTFAGESNLAVVFF